MTSTERTDLVLRRAEPADADAVADLFLESRRAAVPAMPPPVQDRPELAAFFTRRLTTAHDLWLAERDAVPVGFADLAGDWLEALYVHPDAVRAGVGGALLDLAKALRPAGFSLWVFESNAPARAFYRAHGLLELERTDGSGNLEQEPDLRMAWPGEDPLTFLRGQVDAVDDELAFLLARRAALTAAIQRFKAVPGHAGRDPDREAEIVARMARRAPGLGRAAVGRIMHTVIGVSLDEADGDTDGPSPTGSVTNP